MLELSPEALRIVDKVRKLLALAGNNPSQEEAQVALDMAHQLLEEHNIELHTVESTRKTGSHSTKRADEKSGGALYKWQAQVWQDAAKLNFCVYFRIRGLEKGAKYEHRLVGRPENVVMTQVMAEYLQGAIERLARKWAQDRDLNIFAKDAIIFREGAAQRISERLNSLRWDREQEARRREQENKGTGTEVTIFGVKTMEEDLNNDYLNGWEPGTTARQRAEREASYETYRREQAEKKAAHEHRMANDPAYAANWRAVEAAAKKQLDDYNKKEQAKARRREKNGGGYYRRENEQDRRRDSAAYSAGRRAGNDIGLDPQVKKTATKPSGYL